MVKMWIYQSKAALKEWRYWLIKNDLKGKRCSSFNILWYICQVIVEVKMNVSVFVTFTFITLTASLVFSNGSKCFQYVLIINQVHAVSRTQ